MLNGGGIFCFELKGGLEAGKKFLDSLKMLSMTANLGDTRSIASHPASTTHAKLTEEERQAVAITPGLIRISLAEIERGSLMIFCRLLMEFKLHASPSIQINALR
jgi:O-succinylhomoserine sulfhydrylase